MCREINATRKEKLNSFDIYIALLIAIAKKDYLVKSLHYNPASYNAV